MGSRIPLLTGRQVVQRADCHEVTYEGGHWTVTVSEGAEQTLGGTGPPAQLSWRRWGVRGGEDRGMRTLPMGGTTAS